MCNSSPLWVTPVDNSASVHHRTWSTPLPAGIALLGLGTALVIAAIASYQEPPALVLLAVAALGVIITGTVALIRRPRLTLAPGPVLTVRTLRGTREVTPAQVESLELLGTHRLAFRSVQLLIELHDGGLLVFGQWDLGTSPRTVAAELAEAGFTLDDRSAPRRRTAPPVDDA